MSASRDYDPSANLEKIKAQVMWMNSADDFINPPDLGIAEREVKRLKNGQIYFDSRERTNARPWHAHLRRDLEGPPGRTAGESQRTDRSAGSSAAEGERRAANASLPGPYAAIISKPPMIPRFFWKLVDMNSCSRNVTGIK